MNATNTTSENQQANENLLSRFAVTQEELASIAEMAVGARRDAVDNDPRLAGGMFSYIFGTRKLREVFLLKDWEKYCQDNVEGVRCKKNGTVIIFQNVDCAGNPYKEPKPNSAKGPASARAVAKAHHGDLFENIDPNYKPQTNYDLWYFCVSPIGEAELSRPISVDNGDFTGFHDRIFVTTIDQNRIVKTEIVQSHNEIKQDFDIPVERR